MKKSVSRFTHKSTDMFAICDCKFSIYLSVALLATTALCGVETRPNRDIQSLYEEDLLEDDDTNGLSLETKIVRVVQQLNDDADHEGSDEDVDDDGVGDGEEILVDDYRPKGLQTLELPAEEPEYCIHEHCVHNKRPVPRPGYYCYPQPLVCNCQNQGKEKDKVSRKADQHNSVSTTNLEYKIDENSFTDSD